MNDIRNQLNATVYKRINITPELVIFQIKPDAGVPNFLPGQYVALGLMGSAPRPEHFPPEKEQVDPSKIVKRAYSIGSPAHIKDYLEFYVAIVPDGTLTSRLALVEEGDRVFLAPKITGTFVVNDIPQDHNLVLVSTGTGIAPYLAMNRTPEIFSSKRKITVVHGVRFSKDLAYRDELERYASENPNFSYHPIISRDSEGWEGEKGHVQKLFETEKISLTPELDHVFLCGNPAMIEGMQKLLEARGYREHSRKSPGNLHLEKYW